MRLFIPVEELVGILSSSAHFSPSGRLFRKRAAKGRVSVKMDASVFGSTVADQSAYVSQSALYATAGGPVGEEGEARAAAPGLQTSRSFFIIDKSRMVGERDTVEEAKVVYLPENEFMKVSLH